MADIEEYLAQIMAARYGKDVRSSIHDSIEEINEEVDTAVAGLELETTYMANLRRRIEAIPDLPKTNGNYKLRCTVTNGVPVLSWVSDS